MQAEAQLSAAKGRLTSLEERCLKLEKAQREIDKSEARRDRAVAQDKQWRVDNEPKIEAGSRAFKSLDALTSRLGALLTIDAAAEKARGAALLQTVREQDKRIMAYPNAGMPQLDKDHRTVYSQSPEEMAGQVPDLMTSGAQIIGGCCGTTPNHIRAFRQAVDAYTQ